MAVAPRRILTSLIAQLDPLGQAFRVQQVAHAHAHAGRLHLVGGADAAAGGADLVGAALAPLVQGDVVGQDDVRLVGDEQPAGQVEAAVRAGSPVP